MTNAPIPVRRTCSIKRLPPGKVVTAGQKAMQINPANVPSQKDRAVIRALTGLATNQTIPAEHIAIMAGKRWKNGVCLTVSFLDNPPADLQDRILSHMNAWKQYANVEFVASSVDPDVRIARVAGDGYWSYLGTDIRLIDKDKPTMNLDSFDMDIPESEYHRVVRHETGHTLGFPHEHMRDEIVNRIDRQKAFAYFAQADQWSEQEVIDQVLTPLDGSALIKTAQADPQSIMCYWLPAAIMKDHQEVVGGTDIDALDGQFAGQMYPLG